MKTSRERQTKCKLQNKHECKMFPYAIKKYLNDLKYTIKADENLICKLFDYSIFKIPYSAN